MKVHVVLIWEANRISHLPDLDLPEVKDVYHLFRMVHEEDWFPPMKELELCGFQPGSLTIRMMPESKETGFGWLILSPKSPNAGLNISLPPELTEDQKAVLELVNRGLTSAQISIRLGRSRRWVEYRIREIKQIFNVEQRIQLLKFAQSPAKKQASQ